MRTPAGTQCHYYYEDFHRGREQQECRLIRANRRSLPWEPGLCSKCPVPEILRANGSPDMRLELTVKKKLGLFISMDVEAHCVRHGRRIENPILGCAECAAELRVEGLDT
jgi:hypothetical protein